MYIGKEYENGMIAYILKVGDVGYDPNKIKGFSVSLEDMNSNIGLWSNTTNINHGTGRSMWNGGVNNNLIIDSNGTINTAAAICKNYSAGGFDNWYLPTADQLEKIMVLRYQLNLQVGIYLSSSEYDASNLYVRNTETLSEEIQEKTVPGYVRAVREFELDKPLNYIRMVFIDINNENYSSILYWNTFFNTEFTNIQVVNNDLNVEVTLWSKTDIILTDNLFKDNIYLQEFDSDLITSIPTNCFNGCLNLRTINLTKCTLLNDFSFYGCSSLNSVSIPELLYMETNIFSDCTSLISCTFRFLTYLGDNSFYNCTSLTGIDIPSCLNIGYRALSLCTSLTYVNAPACLQIGQRAFQESTALVSVDFPSLLSLGAYSFYYCSSLRNFYGVMVTQVNARSFQGCTSLTTIAFGSARYLGDYAFSECSLLAFTLNSFPFVESVGINVFEECATISAGFPLLTSINTKMFFNCPNLTTVSINNAIEVKANAFDGCTALTSISLPLVKSIYNRAFSNCSALVTVYVPLCNYYQKTSLYVYNACTSLSSVTNSLVLKYSNSGGVDATITQLLTDRPTCTIVYVGETSNKLDNIGGVYSVYADNAAAITGGKKVGEFYRTNTGVFCVVF